MIKIDVMVESHSPRRANFDLFGFFSRFERFNFTFGVCRAPDETRDRVSRPRDSTDTRYKEVEEDVWGGDAMSECDGSVRWP